jgi:hypothetical protein
MNIMDQCFVIQPFDKGKFDKRFNDIFKPAVIKANLAPYRVDEDLSSRIPIDTIEQSIKDSRLCFAEITTNNPNVWYELGYAFALKKDVVMVSCADERTEPFPFDVRHRNIITYQSSSSSDFVTLSEKITQKINAYLASSERVDDLLNSPLVDTEGLNAQEISALIIILENQPTDFDTLTIYRLGEYMGKAGFTDAATNFAIRTLKKKLMIDLVRESDYHGNDYTSCFLTAKGEKWLIDNQDKIRMRKDPLDHPLPPAESDEESDDLPF